MNSKALIWLLKSGYLIRERISEVFDNNGKYVIVHPDDEVGEFQEIDERLFSEIKETLKKICDNFDDYHYWAYGELEVKSKYIVHNYREELYYCQTLECAKRVIMPTEDEIPIEFVRGECYIAKIILESYCKEIEGKSDSKYRCIHDDVHSCCGGNSEFCIDGCEGAEQWEY